MSEKFEHHARTVSLLTMASRVTGLARDAALSRVFGAGGVTDAFFFAFMIPNLFRRLFGEGALSAAFLPVYSRLTRENPEIAQRVASLTIALLVTGLGAVVLLSEIGLYIASSLTDHGNLAVWLMMAMLPYMPLVCLVAVLGAMLQVHGRFGPTAAAPIVLNLFLITTTISLSFMLGSEQRHLHVGVVAASVVAAGCGQVMWALWALRDQGWWTRVRDGTREPMQRILRQALPMILGLGVLQLNTLFDGVIASYPTAVGPTIFGLDYPLTEGAMASVSFAQRLYQFPLAVFGIAVATAIFPTLAKVADDDIVFVDVMRRGLRLVVFIGIPASAGLILVRHELAAVILQGGDFRAEDTSRVAWVLLGYAPAIWAYSMMHVLTRGYYARGDTRTPVKVALGVVLLNAALNCTLIWTPLREAGLAWSTAFCSMVQVSLLVLLLRRRVGRILNRQVLQSWLKSVVAAAAMTALVLAVGLLLRREAPGWGRSLLILSALVPTGGLSFALGAVVLRMPEVSWALGRGSSRTAS